METIGQYLKRTRIEKNIGLHEIFLQTKIRESVLEAIERDDFSQLGGHGFARATVFSYIRALDADEKVALQLFDQCYPASNSEVFTPKVPLKDGKLLISNNVLYIILIGIVVIVLGLIVWHAYENGKLTSPFKRHLLPQDSVSTVQEKPDSTKTVAKPDTMRLKMLQVKKQLAQEPKEQPAKKKQVHKQQALNDTTDYVNDLMFKRASNPLNVTD